MIPSRSQPFPMPGGGAKVATAVEKPAEALPVLAAPVEDVVGDAAPTVATLDTTTPPPPPPPRPKTSGRPGAPITFSATTVEAMIRTLEGCINPKVTFSEDVNAMRAEVSKLREAGMKSILAALKAPA